MDDRLKIVLDPFDFLWGQLAHRLEGLTDEEYFREPVSGCWSIRRRGESRAQHQMGKGEWVLEEGRVEPPPFTTIAWRMGHMGSILLLRHNWTFGSHDLKIDDIEFPSTASDGIEFVADARQLWRDGLETVTSEQCDQIGFSQMPWGLDPQVRFIDLVAWECAEFAHHAAEVACLRDLYRAGGTT